MKISLVKYVGAIGLAGALALMAAAASFAQFGPGEGGALWLSVPTAYRRTKARACDGRSIAEDIRLSRRRVWPSARIASVPIAPSAGPRVLAVCRLMTNSNLVANSPLRPLGICRIVEAIPGGLRLMPLSSAPIDAVCRTLGDSFSEPY